MDGSEAREEGLPRQPGARSAARGQLPTGFSSRSRRRRYWLPRSTSPYDWRADRGLKLDSGRWEPARRLRDVSRSRTRQRPAPFDQEGAARSSDEIARPGPAGSVPPALLLALALSQIDRANDVIELLADSPAHVFRALTVLLAILVLTVKLTQHGRRRLIAVLVLVAAAWGVTLAVGTSEHKAKTEAPAATERKAPPVGQHAQIPGAGPAAGSSPRWRIVGARTIRRLDANGSPVGPSLRLPARARHIAACGRSLFVTYGTAWVAKVNAHTGKLLASYHYRRHRAAGEVACAERSVFLPLTSEGTIVRLTQAELRFETRIAIGLRTSAPVFADGFLFASDRAQNRVAQVDLERNVVVNWFDVPDDPAQLGATADGIAILFERSATVGVLTPDTDSVQKLGRLKTGKHLHLAVANGLIAGVSRQSPVITVFDGASRACGRLNVRPARGFASIAPGADARNLEAIDPRGRVVTLAVTQVERAIRKRERCR